MPAVKKYQPVSVALAPQDRAQLAELAKSKDKTVSEILREAIRWYLIHHEETENKSKESLSAQATRYAADQLVKAINAGVDRICRMLARQGRAIGTLYELSWMSLPDDENARLAFEAAANKAKQRMARHIENDERELADRMKKVVNS
ncbi:MAG TPA: ribbon-helix-helix protein, CopG family [Candidatus Obscuribacterales bacterium]